MPFTTRMFTARPDGSVLYVIDPNITTPYSVVYNINTQWQFMSNTILEVAYVGTRTTGLNFSYNINQTYPGAGAQGPRREPSLLCRPSACVARKRIQRFRSA